MTDMRGSLEVKANGKSYRLWVGMSVLAELQDKHGDNVMQQLEPPAEAGPDWMPKLQIITDLFFGALERYHKDDRDRWLVDDIIAQNEDAFANLMGSSFPDAEEEPAAGGKRKAAKG